MILINMSQKRHARRFQDRITHRFRGVLDKKHPFSSTLTALEFQRGKAKIKNQ